MTAQDFIRHYDDEEKFTTATHRYINANYPQLRHFYFHVPNESATNAVRRIILHNMGVLAGVPDFCFIRPHFWFMELKMPKGSLSPKQKALHERWKDMGIIVEVCRTPEEVIKTMVKQCNSV